MTRLADLTSSQICMLVRLAGDGPAEDAVGLEIGDLHGPELRTADSLVRRGLAKLRPGWRMTFWYSLTEAGRRVREHGAG